MATYFIGRCTVLVEHAGNLLLTQEACAPWTGLWTPPGGHVELGETFAEAAVREAREEGGYAVELTGVQGVYYGLGDGSDGADPADAADIVVCYRARPLDGQDGHQYPLADDVLAARWFTRAEIAALPPERLRFARVGHILADWLAGAAYPLSSVTRSPKNGG